MSIGPYLGVPILEAVAYPSHILWVPDSLFRINFAVCVLFMMVSQLWLGGMAIFGGIVLFVVGHGFLAWQYRRDPHVASLWWAALTKCRRWPWQRSRNLMPVDGNRYAA